MLAESFPSLIQQRTTDARTSPSELESGGYWFHHLDDKIAGYLLFIDQQAPAPEIFRCETDVTKLYQCLEEKVFTKDLDGIVIKATNFHSRQRLRSCEYRSCHHTAVVAARQSDSRELLSLMVDDA